MNSQYKGRARREVMEPLLRIASLPDKVELERTGEEELRGEIGSRLTLSLRLIDPSVRMTVLEDGEGSYDVEMNAWGSSGSKAYWYPFAPLMHDVGDDQTVVDLAEVTERARTLLNDVSFFDSDEAALDSSERATAAVEYLRQRSGVTDTWLISLAAPFELRLDDDSIGDGDGLLLEFGELPPGLSDRGECAVVELDHGTPARWWLRPAVLSFEQRVADQAAVVERLQAAGFTDDEIAELDRIADEVAGRHQEETASRY